MIDEIKMYLAYEKVKHILKGVNMNANLKTTIAGIVAVVPQVVAALTNFIPPVMANLITAIAAAIGFYFAKDKDVTGAGKDAVVVK